MPTTIYGIADFKYEALLNDSKCIYSIKAIITIAHCPFPIAKLN
ncbi:hypothetical protein [Cyanobacterium stanieri]|nr:hypothetical protein [Cyanobacterium stanieri]